METTRQLEKKIQEKIDSKFLDKINMNNELDIFHGIVSNCLQLLSHSLENQCEQPLLIMNKNQQKRQQQRKHQQQQKPFDHPNLDFIDSDTEFDNQHYCF